MRRLPASWPLDASIARGDLEASSQDLARLLGHPATPLAEVAGAAHNAASPGQASPAADFGR
jgi:hypothetical protein